MTNRTNHMECRMRQRAITEDMVNTILELGDWNERGDRIILPRRVLTPEIQKRRKELKILEIIQRRKGLSLVLDGETQITVYSNSKRMHS